ncbi:MAG: hypothetical protein ABIW16_06255 [Sphingomicrobium sp.]
MSRKFSAARKRAFLSYLAQSGNQTLSAERAAVSRSWVRLHRAQDAGFDAACREALRQAQDRLSTSPHPAQPAAESPSPAAGRGSSRPASGWRFFDGAELVMRGSGGRGGGHRVQIARARAGQWTARVEARFLTALTATCNVQASCAVVGKSFSSAYGHALRWPEFAAQWAAAVTIGYGQIETALLETGLTLLSGREEIAVAPISAMSADQALHLLHMHMRAVKGIGGVPGRQAERPVELARATRRLELLMRRMGLIGWDA